MITRRTLLLAGLGLSATALAGCQSGDAAPAPADWTPRNKLSIQPTVGPNDELTLQVARRRRTRRPRTARRLIADVMNRPGRLRARPERHGPPTREVARLAVKFPDFSDPETPYMCHCHILRHEDAGMMGQFVLVEPGSEESTSRTQGSAHREHASHHP